MRKRRFIVVVLVVLAAIVLIRRRSGGPAGTRPRRPAGVADTGPTILHSFIHEGPAPTRFREAPALAEQVRAGTLPPVEERLPEAPLVIPPVEEIGEYGGTWRRAFTGPADRQNPERLLHDHVLYYDLDGTTIVPHIAKSWEVSEDRRTFTFTLRKGMKWSDGAPFTADDILFAYEDMLLNDELNPVKPSRLSPGGKLAIVEKLDTYTYRYVFAEPYPLFLELYAAQAIGGQGNKGRKGRGPYAPGHYLKQFHPRYVPEEELSARVKAAGLSNWTELFKLRSDIHLNPDLPVVGPWKMIRPITGQTLVLERNPYYWAVDPAGNQLPYIDRIAMRMAGNLEVLNFRAMAGEIDMQHRHIQLAKVPVLKANSEKEGYRVLFWPEKGGSQIAVFVNQDWEGDAEIEKWLGSRDFRIALSLAVDREEINESILLGIGKPRANLPSPDSAFYPGPEYETRHAVLDRKRANDILDRLGLEKRNSEGFRLRRDGAGPVTIDLSVMGSAFLDYVGAAELVQRHWARVGIRTNVSVQERSLWVTRRGSHEHLVTIWNNAGANMPWLTGAALPTLYASRAAQWHDTLGRKGREPAGELKRLLELHDAGKGLSLSQRAETGREIWRIIVDNAYIIGTVGESPAFNGVVVVNNNFRNVPRTAPNAGALQTPGIARPEQFFMKSGAESSGG